jgi:hypothetical protein
VTVEINRGKIVHQVDFIIHFLDFVGAAASSIRLQRQFSFVTSAAALKITDVNGSESSQRRWLHEISQYYFKC